MSDRLLLPESLVILHPEWLEETWVTCGCKPSARWSRLKSAGSCTYTHTHNIHTHGQYHPAQLPPLVTHTDTHWLPGLSGMWFFGLTGTISCRNRLLCLGDIAFYSLFYIWKVSWNIKCFGEALIQSIAVLMTMDFLQLLYTKTIKRPCKCYFKRVE